MAYYLKFDGVGSYVAHSDITLSGTFSVKIRFNYRTSKTNQTLFGGTSATAVRIDNTSSVLIRIAGTSITRTFLTPLVLGSDYTFILTRDESDVIDLTDENGVSVINATLAKDGDITFDTIGGQVNGTTNFAQLDLYGIEYISGGTTVVNYDPSASNGTGSTLLDTVGGNDGTLVNFPTDDSQWVYYSQPDSIISTNWSRRVEISEAATSGVSLDGFVALLTEANLPSEIWSVAKDGGDDLAICTSDNGNGRLPLEIVTFDTVNQKAVIWFRFETFNSGASVWLFYGHPDAVQPDVAEPFGRNAVWVDLDAVFHLNEASGDFINSVGDGNDATVASESGVTRGATGVLAACVDLDGNQNAIIPQGSYWNDLFNTHTISAWCEINGENTGPNIILEEGGTVNGAYIVYRPNPDTFNYGVRVEYSTYELSSTTTFAPNSGFIKVVGTFDNGVIKLFINGVLEDSLTIPYSSIPGHLNSAGIGSVTSSASVEAGTPWFGKISHVKRRQSTTSESFESTEYANQASPETFWTTGTPEDAPLPVSSDVNVSFVILGVGSATSDSGKDSPNTYSFGAVNNITFSSIKEISNTFILSSGQSISSTQYKQSFDSVTTVSTTSSQVIISKQTDTSQIIESTNNITVYVGSLLLVDITMAVSNSSSITTSSSKGISQNISSTNNTTLTSSWSIDKSISSAVANGVSLTASQTKRLPVILNASSATNYDALHELTKAVGFDVFSVISNTQAIEIEKAIDTLYQGNSSILVYLDTDQARHIAISIQLASNDTLTSSEIINKLSQIDNILAASSLSTVSNKALEQSINYSLVSELSAEFILTKKVAAGLTSSNQLLSVISKNTDTDIENDAATALLMQQTASRVAQTDFDVSSISSTVLEIDIDKNAVYVLNSDTDSSIEIYFNKKLNAIQIATDSSITTVLNPEGSDSLKNIIKVPVVTKIETHNISDTTVVNPTVVQELTIVHDSVVPIRTTVLGGD